ncbi:hypothetical protein [Shewanella indica]|uniref:hypothetical protein n=1 Tax=Shewanella indica TaxID=768528 RepID=UPI0030063369
MNDHIAMWFATTASESLKSLQSMSQSLAELNSWGPKDTSTLILSLAAILAPALANYFSNRRELRKELASQIQNLRRANSAAIAFSTKLSNSLFKFETTSSSSKSVVEHALKDLDRHATTTINTIDISLSSMYHEHPILDGIRFNLEQVIMNIQFDLRLWADDEDNNCEVNQDFNNQLYLKHLQNFCQAIESVLEKKFFEMKKAGGKDGGKVGVSFL